VANAHPVTYARFLRALWPDGLYSSGGPQRAIRAGSASACWGCDPALPAKTNAQEALKDLEEGSAKDDERPQRLDPQVPPTRKSKATECILEFAKSAQSIGDMPMAVKKYLHKVRVVQRNGRSHLARMHCILEIRARQLHKHEEEAAKHQKNKPKQSSKSSRKMKALYEEQVLRKHLRPQLKKLGAKLHAYRLDLAAWRQEKAEDDRIQEDRAAVMQAMGLKEDKSRIREDTCGPPPAKPYLRIALTPEELKLLVKEVTRLERTGKNQEGNTNDGPSLEEMAGLKPVKKKMAK